MTESLPDRPDIDQLRRQAKELRDGYRRGDDAATARVTRQLRSVPVGDLKLALAQLVLAREYGFPNWPALKAGLEAARRRAEHRLEAFLAASLENLSEAQRLLADTPDLAGAPMGAVVIGDPARVAEILAADPGWVSRPDEIRGWSPILYACYSVWHRAGPAWAEASLDTVRQLLDAGASPDSHNGRLPNRGYRSALHGSVHAGNAGLCRLLLARGAHPNDRVSLREAAETAAIECLRALVDHDATVEKTWSLETAAAAGHADSVRVLLEATRTKQGAGKAAQMATLALTEGVGVHCLESPAALDVVQALTSFGADPDGTGGDVAPLRLAVRAGRPDVASVLRAAGATASVTRLDQLIGACTRGDQAEVESLLDSDPELAARLVADEAGSIVELAASPTAGPVRLLLQTGVPVSARNEFGETALHTAAYHGRPDTVRLLLEHGAEVDALDANFSATPLAFATVGSRERAGADGDWCAVVTLLLDAGASRDDVWLSGSKAPSDQVAAVLAGRGVTPQTDDHDAQPTDQVASTPALPDEQAVLDDVAEQLRTAYQTGDLELFGSLLHPDVQFGGGPLACTSRDEVLTRYRETLVRLGVHAEDLEVHTAPGAVVVSARFGGRAQGGRDPEPERAYQRFTVAGGLITSITGHPSLAAAMGGGGG